METHRTLHLTIREDACFSNILEILTKPNNILGQKACLNKFLESQKQFLEVSLTVWRLTLKKKS